MAMSWRNLKRGKNIRPFSIVLAKNADLELARHVDGLPVAAQIDEGLGERLVIEVAQEGSVAGVIARPVAPWRPWQCARRLWAELAFSL